MNAFEVLQSVYKAGGPIQFSKTVRRVKVQGKKGKDVRVDPEYTSVEVLIGGYQVQPIVDGSKVPFFFLADRADVDKALHAPKRRQK